MAESLHDAKRRGAAADRMARRITGQALSAIGPGETEWHRAWRLDVLRHLKRRIESEINRVEGAESA